LVDVVEAAEPFTEDAITATRRRLADAVTNSKKALGK
jgi:hypothetical protein